MASSSYEPGPISCEGAAFDDFRLTAHLPPDGIITRMHGAVTAFAGGTHQADDLTAVVIKRTA